MKRAILGADAGAGVLKLGQRIDAEDEAGEIVHRLVLKDTITIEK